MKTYNKSVFIFRRDLRLVDNTGLNKALTLSKKVYCCFIFDPRQVGKQNTYRSLNAVQFMITSLKKLEEDIKAKEGNFYFFYGLTETIVSQILREIKPEALFVNRDYTPFSIKRDQNIQKQCKSLNCHFDQSEDLLLTNPETIYTKQGTPFKVFTPFYKQASSHPITKPTTKRGNFSKFPVTSAQSLANICEKHAWATYKNPQLFQKGGRAEAIAILRNIGTFKNYAKTRDFPSIPTTGLSAHNKFGTVSIREVYYAIIAKLGKTNPLLRQLYWRDFYTYIAFHFPYVFGNPFRTKYNSLKWETDKKLFKRWYNGLTGLPIVDAGMRQMNFTGYMHNRTRMIAASFLIKDLHLNWLWGEKYFAHQLVDYDPSVNNGNWQWSASTGCDAQPYFRIFNPWLQQKKFDPECTYIKTWIPELKDVPVKVIQNWYKQEKSINNYPLPIVNHKHEKEKSIIMFQQA